MRNMDSEEVIMSGNIDSRIPKEFLRKLDVLAKETPKLNEARVDFNKMTNDELVEYFARLQSRRKRF